MEKGQKHVVVAAEIVRAEEIPESVGGLPGVICEGTRHLDSVRSGVVRKKDPTVRDLGRDMVRDVRLACVSKKQSQYETTRWSYLRCAQMP